jgi:hypothetical protein
MRHKNPLMSILIILMLLGLTLPAAAITFGEPDGDAHPYVGLVVFDGEDSPIGTPWTCSGTLLSPKVFLTAGHCTYYADEARVWFDPDPSDNPDYPDDGWSSVAAEIYTHPDFDGYLSFPNTRDIGILILRKPVKLEQYGELPDLDYLDDLSNQRGLQDVIIRTVGYGAQMIKPAYKEGLIRYTSTSMLVNLSSHLTDGFNIHTSNNPGQGHQTTGGSCIGDSGGPILYPEDSDTVVGVVSFGLNSNCKGADFAYRTDIVEAQDFIKSFLPLKKTNK